MDRNELREWFGGPVAHIHLRSEDDPQFFNGSEKHQFTQEAALHYLRLLTGNPDTRITDTNHVLIDFDVDNLDRPKGISKEELKEKIVAEASAGTLTRLAKVRQNPGAKNVIIGVEADIIDDRGGLSLNNDCLSHLDFTIASFHSFIWSAFSEEHNYTKQYLMKAYESVAMNPHVDVLGHATRPSSRTLNIITADDYENLLGIMSQQKVALEINLLEDFSSSKEALTLEVIQKAITTKVPLVVGSDFHHFEETQFAKGLEVFSGVVNKENIQKVFAENRGFHSRLFRRLFKNIQILNHLGVTKEMIVNSSDENFNRWLRERRKK